MRKENSSPWPKLGKLRRKLRPRRKQGPEERRRLKARTLETQGKARPSEKSQQDGEPKKASPEDPNAHGERSGLRAVSPEPAASCGDGRSALEPTPSGYRKLNTRSQKKYWKRRELTGERSQQVRQQWAADEESRNKNVAGRKMAAADRLRRRGFSSSSPDRAISPAIRGPT